MYRAYSNRIITLFLTGVKSNKAGLYERSFSGLGGQFDSRFIFQEELIQYQYNSIQLLNNLFRVG